MSPSLQQQAPASATVDMFRDPGSPDGALLPFYPNRITSGLAVGVPGTPTTWAEVLSRYGTLTLAEALQPAIALAEQGVEVDAVFSRQIEQNQSRFAALTSTAELYLPQGRPPQVGERFANSDLAKTYRLLTEQGINTFYRGEIAEAMASPRISQRNGGSTWVDQGFEQTELGQALVQIGHSLNSVAELGAATGILMGLDGTQVAAAEPIRRGGAGVVQPD